MNSSLFNKIPPPLAGKTGWPWTEEAQPIPSLMSVGKPWPKISIVTPSYNQGQFLEETIRSVLLQKYPNLEYVVIDGGSTDGSIEIIKKYEKYFKYWISEPDRGQVHAINKGFERTTGTIISWLNSDDIYAPNILYKIADFFSSDLPDKSIVIGERINIAHDGTLINRQTIGHQPVTLFQVLYLGRWPFFQESVFFTKDIYCKVGKLYEKYNLLFDFEFFVRCLHYCSAQTLPKTLIGCWRHHDAQKIHPSIEIALQKEMAEIFSAYRRKYCPKWLLKILWSLGRRTVWKNDRTITIEGNIGEMRG